MARPKGSKNKSKREIIAEANLKIQIGKLKGRIAKLREKAAR